jgi:hypothetical protein
LTHAGVLRLPGHDVPARLGHGLVELPAGKEHDAGLKQSGEQRQEWRRCKTEFDCGGAAIVTDKTPEGPKRLGTNGYASQKCREHDALVLMLRF